MKVGESYNTTNKKPFSFNMQDGLDDKIDKLTSMISKLTAQGNAQDKQDKQFKLQIYGGRMRGLTRQNYDQGNYQTKNRSSSGDRRMSFRDRARGRFIQNDGQNYRQNYRGRQQDNYRNDYSRGNYREMQNYRGQQNYRSGCKDSCRDNYRNDNNGRSRRSRSRERQYTCRFRRDDSSSKLHQDPDPVLELV